MKILGISGSGRRGSSNTAMLRAVAVAAGPAHGMTVYEGVAGLPVFSPDLEAGPLPKAVQVFAQAVRASDCLIIASPEYVRSIPGGLKNAIDWLVSREEIIDKPIALMHATHRGDDMLAQLRLVLGTVSKRFAPEVFVRFALMTLSPEEIAERLQEPANRALVAEFLRGLAGICDGRA